MLGTAHKFRPRGRGGQVVIFLMMAFVALMFLVLWNADLHRIVTMKARSQDAGDAAALAAARWQASSLNLIGELNLMHALALSDGNDAAVDALTNIQARLCLTGPLAGVVAAQQAAKQNGVHANAEFDAMFESYIDDVASCAVTIPAYYPDAQEEYIDMLEAVLADRIAAQPPYPSVSAGGHILFDPAFYDAVATRDWCWFERNHPGLLEEYTDYSWWPELPPPPDARELYPLRVRPVTARLLQLVDLLRLTAQADAAGIDLTPVAATNVAAPQTWYCYEGAWWGSWERLNTEDPIYPFPVVGPAKPEYNYAGADALASVETYVQPMTPGMEDNASFFTNIGWTAAAKAFGYVGDNDAREPPATYGLVVPAFRDVRLIPLDASSGDGKYDSAMQAHFAFHCDGSGHLQRYVATGEYHPGCWYCLQLQTWDQPAFRQDGIAWLQNHDCTPPPGPGPGGPGGGGGGHAPPHIGH